MIRGVLIGLVAIMLALQGVALRAAPLAGAPGEGSPGLQVHLCSGALATIGPDGTLVPADEPHDAAGDPAAHPGCLDCCIAPLALPAPEPHAPARRAAPGRVDPACGSPDLQGLAAPAACARAPPADS